MPTLKGKNAKRQYNVQEMVATIKRFPANELIVILEMSQSMPKQGVSSTFSIGKGFGIWQGILSALGIRFAIVHPKTWQKEVLKDIDRTDTKQASAIVAQRIFPGVVFKATERCKVIHSGLTDAVCMAEYGLRLYGQKIEQWER